MWRLWRTHVTPGMCTSHTVGIPQRSISSPEKLLRAEGWQQRSWFSG